MVPKHLAPSKLGIAPQGEGAARLGSLFFLSRDVENRLEGFSCHHHKEVRRK